MSAAALGADLRARFDGLAEPVTELSAVRGRVLRSHRRGALVAVLLMLLVAGVLTLIAFERNPQPASGPGGSWTRTGLHTAFGRDAGAVQIVASGPGFVAVGTRGVLETGLRPAVWTSTDGVRWDAVKGARFPSGRRFSGFRSVAARHDELVASTQANELWYSRDAKIWRRASLPGAPALDGVNLTEDPSTFIALGSTAASPSASAPVWTSLHGHRWSAVALTGAPPVGFGLFPAARLHESWFAVGATSLSDSEARGAFASRDGLHWAAVAKANVPDRFGNILANNAARTRVLGIQVEHYQPRYSFGGRLWSTSNGSTWTEITSFHHQLPVANPDRLVRLGRWWVLSGNTGTADGLRRASMWTSPDLRRWYEMPRRLQGRESTGSSVGLTVAQGRVVGTSGGRGSSFVWVWSPPH